MADINLKTETPDTTLPTTGFLFGADSQAAASPSVYSTQTVATTLLGSTTLTGATVTTSQPVLDLSQTWNDGGTTFTGLRFNVTNTASASGSRLMDLQVGGTSIFSIRPDGYTLFRISEPAGFNLLDGNGNNYLRLVATSAPLLGLGSSGSVSWRSAATLGAGAYDTSITRSSAGVVNINSTLRIASNGFISSPAAARIQLGAADAAAPVAQTLSVQSVVAGTTNTAGQPFTITGSQGTGTGAGGSIIFQVAPAGSSGTAQNALATALTINGDQTVQFASTIALGGSSGATLFKQSASNYIEAGTGFSIEAGGSSGIAMMKASGGNHFNAGQNAYYGWNGINGVSSPDLRLYRDAANTLAQRNGANAQTFRVYNTYTSATDFERANIFWDSNVLKIGTEKGSAGGTARALEFQTDGTTRLTISADGNLISSGSASITIPGSRYYAWDSRGGLIAPGNGVISLRDSAGTSFNRLQFGGTTSSFPALKRDSASLVVRLADDSANAALESASLKTDAPTGGTAATWKLGTVATVSPTSPDRTIEVEIGGTTYYISAKTTND